MTEWHVHCLSFYGANKKLDAVANWLMTSGYRRINENTEYEYIVADKFQPITVTELPLHKNIQWVYEKDDEDLCVWFYTLSCTLWWKLTGELSKIFDCKIAYLCRSAGVNLFERGSHIASIDRLRFLTADDKLYFFTSELRKLHTV